MQQQLSGGGGALDNPSTPFYLPPLPEETLADARRIVAGNAKDADECREFFGMLDIWPAK